MMVYLYRKWEQQTAAEKLAQSDSESWGQDLAGQSHEPQLGAG